MKHIRIQFSYISKEEKHVRNAWPSWTVDNGRAWSWNYHCQDIYTDVTNRATGRDYRVTHIGLEKVHGDKDLWVDHVMFLDKPLVVEDAWGENNLLCTIITKPLLT